jgi:hypothetical protein
VDDVAGVHEKYFGDDGSECEQEDALKYVGLVLPVFARKEKEGKEYGLHNTQEYKNGKQVDAIVHRRSNYARERQCIKYECHFLQAYIREQMRLLSHYFLINAGFGFSLVAGIFIFTALKKI